MARHWVAICRPDLDLDRTVHSNDFPAHGFLGKGSAFVHTLAIVMIDRVGFLGPRGTGRERQ